MLQMVEEFEFRDKELSENDLEIEAKLKTGYFLGF